MEVFQPLERDVAPVNAPVSTLGMNGIGLWAGVWPSHLGTIRWHQYSTGCQLGRVKDSHVPPHASFFICSPTNVA